MEARIAIIAMTTSNSIKVKARTHRPEKVVFFIGYPFLIYGWAEIAKTRARPAWNRDLLMDPKAVALRYLAKRLSARVKKDVRYGCGWEGNLRTLLGRTGWPVLAL